MKGRAGSFFAPFLLLAASPKEGLHDLTAGFFKEAGDHVGAMIQSGVVENFEPGASAPPLRVGHSPNHDGEAGEYDRSGAHRARFFGDIEDAVGESPVAEGIGGLGDGDHFRVGSGVMEQFDLIVGLSEQAVALDNDCPDGNFPLLGGEAG